MRRKFSAVQEHCPPENHSPFATRYSPFAAVLALTGGSCSRTTENWTNSAAQESSPPVSFPHDRNFSARQSRALQKNHLLLATRYSLLAVVSTRQEPRPLIFLVPRPTLLVPLKVSTHALCHQLRAKAHSMDCFSAIINYGLKPLAWSVSFNRQLSLKPAAWIGTNRGFWSTLLAGWRLETLNG
jgi:hypothetical protein